MSAIAAAMLALVVQAVRPLPHEDDEAARRRAWRTPSLLLSGESLELDLVGRHPLRAPSVRAGRGPSGVEAPEPLARWGAVAITGDGRALVQDERTGEVHVFGPGGEHRFVCSPPQPTRGSSFCALATDFRGRILVQRRVFEDRVDIYDDLGHWSATESLAGLGRAGGRPRLVGLSSSVAGSWFLDEDDVLQRIVDGRVQVSIPARPDGRGWRAVSVGARRDGGWIVRDGARNGGGGICMLAPEAPPDPDPREFLFVYDARGRIARRMVLPVWLQDAASLLDGEPVLFVRGSDGIDAVDLLDLRTDRVHHAVLAHGPRPEGPVRVVEVGGRAELWRANPDTRSLERFALPFATR